MHIFNFVVLKDVKLIIPPSGKLFMIHCSSPFLDEAHRKRFHIYRASIFAATAFLTIRVTKATEDDDDKLLRLLKYLRGTV